MEWGSIWDVHQMAVAGVLECQCRDWPDPTGQGAVPGSICHSLDLLAMAFCVGSYVDSLGAAEPGQSV